MRGRGLPEEEHHFTISSAPNPNGAVTSTIRNIGDFTATVCDTKPGDSARVHGPFGRFSHTLHPEEKRVVFIAGGIGITPVMSMLRHMRDVGWPKPALLIYANSSRDKIVFRDEIDAMHENINGFKAVHVLSRPDDGWEGETGHVDRELIERHAAPFTPDTGWYLCGPQGLMESAISDLEALGVPEKRMHREIFRFI
jgi:ferredoxin-NADP reductase